MGLAASVAASIPLTTLGAVFASGAPTVGCSPGACSGFASTTLPVVVTGAAEGAGLPASDIF